MDLCDTQEELVYPPFICLIPIGALILLYFFNAGNQPGFRSTRESGILFSSFLLPPPPPPAPNPPNDNHNTQKKAYIQYAFFRF